MHRLYFKNIINCFNNGELIDLISVSQGVLSALFSYYEIKNNIKTFYKGYEYSKYQCKDVNKNGKPRDRQNIFAKYVDVHLMSSLYLHFSELN